MKKRILILSAILLFLFTASGTEALAKDTEAGGKIYTEAEDIENNGGNFVRAGSRVYFRKYGPEALKKQISGNSFLELFNAAGGSSDIMYYDTETKKVEKAFSDYGCGGLYYSDGSLYLNEWMNGHREVFRYKIDTGEAEHIAAGTIRGISPSGYLALEEEIVYDREGSFFHIYKDGEEVCELGFEESCSYTGITDRALYLMTVSYDNEHPEYAYWEIPFDGEEAAVLLGTIEDEDGGRMGAPGQFLEDEGRIGIVHEYRIGAGNYLDSAEAYTAEAGKEESLKAIRGTGDPDWPVPRLYIDKKGNIAAAKYLKGDRTLNEKGDLSIYDGEDWILLAEDFTLDKDTETGYRRNYETAEYVADGVFGIVACEENSPVDAAWYYDGWALLGMEYSFLPGNGEDGIMLAETDYETQLEGIVWLSEDRDDLLWQQLGTDEMQTPRAEKTYRLPISEDVEWEDGKRAFMEDAAFYKWSDLENGDYYGYPVPKENGCYARLRLNKDGEIIGITRIDSHAFLRLEYDLPERSMKNPVEDLKISRRNSDEDTQQHKAKITSYQDGLRVRLERSKDDPNTAETVYMQEAGIVPGEVLFDGILNRGEYITANVTFPWHPELRISASKDGLWGSYTFGEDNYMHLNDGEDGVPEMTLAGYPVAAKQVSLMSEEEFNRFMYGMWICRDPEGSGHTRLVYFNDDGTFIIYDEEENISLEYSLERFFADEWHSPDLLSLRSVDKATVKKTGMKGSAGDYLMEFYLTEGDTILHLEQINNGDGALNSLMRDKSDGYVTEFDLHRYYGNALPGALAKSMTFPARVVRYDEKAGTLWLQEAEITDEMEDGSPWYTVKGDAICLEYPIGSESVKQWLEKLPRPDLPMQIMEVTVDAEGAVTALAELP